MKRKKRYGYHTVMAYIEDLVDPCIDIIEGSLLDTYIIYHSEDLIEVFEETYVNAWSSDYTRHIYKKGLPARFIKALEEQEAYYNEH